MDEKPIIFSPQMVNAIFRTEGIPKTHTRRLAGLGRINVEPDGWVLKYWNYQYLTFFRESDHDVKICKLRYKVDDILWIKETYHITPAGIVLKSDFLRAIGDQTDTSGFKWCVSMFMKKEYARPERLRVISVKPCRLFGITDKEANEEGFYDSKDPVRSVVRFIDYWDLINGKKHPFKGNWWVWDYGFERVR